MNNSNDNTARPDVQNDVIVLGVASVETLGGGGPEIESEGFVTGIGISEN